MRKIRNQEIVQLKKESYRKRGIGCKTLNEIAILLDKNPRNQFSKNFAMIIPDDLSAVDLYSALQEATGVPVSAQKIISNGKQEHNQLIFDITTWYVC